MWLEKETILAKGVLETVKFCVLLGDFGWDNQDKQSY